MNNEHDDDLAQAKAWLSMDPKEHANRVAEMAKRSAQRHAALAYGDSGSPTEPVTFAPLPECVGCDDPLTHDNRSGIRGLCLTCLTINNAHAAKFQSDHKAKVIAKADKSFPYLVMMVAIAGTALGLAAWYGPRAIGWIIFRLAGG